MNNINSILIDKYGNYTIQKLYQHISLSMKVKLLESIDFYLISTNDTGTYPLQSIVENSKTNEEKDMIIKKYSPHFLQLSLSKNGNHVIEKSLMNTTIEKALVFFDIVIENFITLACDQYGIKILKIFCHGMPKVDKYFDLFEEKVFTNIECLINHEFGNYLIQSVIDTWKIFFSWKIVEKYDKKLLNLSMNKYSSNVLEKLITKLETVSFIYSNLILETSRSALRRNRK